MAKKTSTSKKRTKAAVKKVTMRDLAPGKRKDVKAGGSWSIQQGWPKKYT